VLRITNKYGQRFVALGEMSRKADG